MNCDICKVVFKETRKIEDGCNLNVNTLDEFLHYFSLNINEKFLLKETKEGYLLFVKDEFEDIIIYTLCSNGLVNGLIKEFESEIIYDYLTKAINKKNGLLLIEKDLEKHKRYNTPFCVVVCDIDFFKKINDTYGHLCGDNVLKEISHIFQSNLRKSDFFIRFGGEEFIVLLSNTKMVGALKAIEKIQNIIREYKFFCNNKILKVTLSFGITSPQINDSLESLLKRADEAVYMAKKNGRDRIEYL